jgi:hypothetical protein
MRSSPNRSLPKRLTFLGALALAISLGYLAVWFVSATSSRAPHALQAAAQRGEVERGTFWVTNQNGAVAAVHYWQPTGSNAQDVVFEPQGDRVLLRAVPRAHPGS